MNAMARSTCSQELRISFLNNQSIIQSKEWSKLEILQQCNGQKFNQKINEEYLSIQRMMQPSALAWTQQLELRQILIKNVAIHDASLGNDASFKSSNSALFSTKLNEEEYIWIHKDSNSVKKKHLNPNSDRSFRSAVQSQEAQPKKINQEYLILKNDAKFWNLESKQ